MNEIFERLVKVANTLDCLGMYEYADQIDLMVLASGQRTRAVDDFIKELKRIFTIVANDPRVPSINMENLEVITNVIDTLADKGTFLGPRISEDSMEQLKDEVNIAVEGLVELSRAIIKLNKALETEKDPSKLQGFKMDLDNDRKKLGEIWKMVNGWRTGRRSSDTDKYKRFEEIWNKRKNEIEF